MENLFESLRDNCNRLDLSYRPLYFNLQDASDREKLHHLIQENNVFFIEDKIYSQLEELIKCRHPSSKLTEAESKTLIDKHLNETDLQHYGTWVYYPWSRKLIHLLGEAEFVEVRTNRNKNKITIEEQAILQSKKIGIVGLSVGQSIALTLATERTCGELRLADFDTAELSNLNRIRTGVENLGISKTIIAAREISEIDPFLKVKIYSEGLTKDNIDAFFSEDGQLDLFVEVCDSLDIKIETRVKAKSLKIPVVMDTNDRGMLDIERFDLDPERSIFHGYLDDFMINDHVTITDENRTPILKSILSFESLSERMKLSMLEIGKTINTWPQLASSVVLGGAITTDISRRILLEQHSKSGRYYVDLDAIFNDENTLV